MALPDPRAANEAAKAGLPRDRLHATGQPALDDVARAANAWTDADRRRVRQVLGLDAEDWLLVFFAQPIRRMHPPGSERHRGYDEDDALDLLDELLEVADADARVGVRPHPSEDPNKYRGRGDIPPTRMADLDYRDAILSADVAAGMTSIALVHAAVAGRPVLSLQPGLEGHDALVLGRIGAVTPVTQPPTDPAAARQFLDPDPVTDLPPTWTDQGSVNRILDRLGEMTP